MSWIENINEKNIEEWIDEFKQENLGDHRSFELLGVLIEVYRKAQKERDQLRELCVELLSALKDLNDNEGDFNEDIHSYIDWKNSREKANLAITKAEKALGVIDEI